MGSCKGFRLCIWSQIYVFVCISLAEVPLTSPRVHAAGRPHGGLRRLGFSVLLVQFEGGRSAEEIRKFWQNSEHPSINKQEWSGQEVDQLKAIAAKHGHLEWQKIAEELGVRTWWEPLSPPGQCGSVAGRPGWVCGLHGLHVIPRPAGPSEPSNFFVLLLLMVWPSGRVSPARLPGLSLQELCAPQCLLPHQTPPSPVLHLSLSITQEEFVLLFEKNSCPRSFWVLLLIFSFPQVRPEFFTWPLSLVMKGFKARFSRNSLA